MNVGLEHLIRLRDQHGSVFVFGVRGGWFWSRGIEAYPFVGGVLVIRQDDDEHRWPGAFLTAIAEGKYTLHSDLPGDRAAAFRDEWMAHLAGIVEYAPVPVTLPSWAFPPGEGDLHVR
ncbi:MAG: hypothetical protein U0R19_15595 [Bryobacteraceae bacterium]